MQDIRVDGGIHVPLVMSLRRQRAGAQSSIVRPRRLLSRGVVGVDSHVAIGSPSPTPAVPEPIRVTHE